MSTIIRKSSVLAIGVILLISGDVLAGEGPKSISFTSVVFNT